MLCIFPPLSTLAFPEAFRHFKLTSQCHFLSLFVTNSVSYLRNNALIRKANNQSLSGGSTPTAENRCQCLTRGLLEKQKQEKKNPTYILQHCSAVSHVMCFVFSAGGKACTSGAAHRCRLREQVHNATL